MKKYSGIKLLFAGFAFACLLGAAPLAYGALPPVNVTVFNAAGKVVFRGPIGSNASFATPALGSGEYIVQFNAKDGSAKDNQYLLVVSAGKKKVIASGVLGETLLGGGAAMRVQVASGANITGQVLNEQDTAVGQLSKSRVINGKRFVWISGELGSNRGGHWQEEGIAPALNVVVWKADDFRKRQDRGGEGSMITHPDHLLPGGKG